MATIEQTDLSRELIEAGLTEQQIISVTQIYAENGYISGAQLDSKIAEGIRYIIEDTNQRLKNFTDADQQYHYSYAIEQAFDAVDIRTIVCKPHQFFDNYRDLVLAEWNKQIVKIVVRSE